MHDHTIDDSFARKILSFLREALLVELRKGYTAAEVLNRFRGVGRATGYTVLESVGGAWLTRQDVNNIARVIKTGMTDIRRLAHGMSFQEDWDAATSFLGGIGYLWEKISATDYQGNSTAGLVFAYPTRLKILGERGYLTLFDSTHKLNLYSYNLFSFTCRDTYGNWVPGGHCLVERENSAILTTALQKLKIWSENKWRMVYALTDDSAVEQRAVKNAFPLYTEPNGHLYGHLLCTVHSERTLQRRFNTKPNSQLLQCMRKAMFCYQETQCIALCNEAIGLSKSDKDRKYLQKEWLNTRAQWAMFARQHSQILRQVTTANPSEAWHEKLKGGAGLVKGETSKHGILGCVRTVHDCAHDIDNRVKKAQFDERTLQTTLTKRYPRLADFPYAVQRLMSTEESHVNSRIQEGRIVEDFEFINSMYICHCRFFHRYQLPCRHIFQKDRQDSFLTTDLWAVYSLKFQENGMEVFETPISNTLSQTATTEPQGAEGRIGRILQVREVNERIRSTFYKLKES
ncbi:hypothetical protein HOY82DRAFT_505303, partial [Tuber indicum]